MKNKLTFRAFYYANNVAFSFLLLFTTIGTVLLISRILQTLGLLTDVPFNIKVDFKHVRQWLSGLLLTCSFYQTFLALYSIKQDLYTDIYWTSKFKNGARLLLILAVLNLITITDTIDNHWFFIQYATQDKIISISNSSPLYLAGAICAYFISGLKPQIK